MASLSATPGLNPLGDHVVETVHSTKRPFLTIIQSTHASMDGLKRSGLLGRHRRLLQEYLREFDVVVYSSDEADYSAELGVRHVPVPWLPRRFGWRHLAFFLWLVWKAPHMRGVIKVFGSNIPTLPLVRLLSRRPMMVTYQFDYAGLAKISNPDKDFKAMVSQWMERLALTSADLVLVTTSALQCKIESVYRKATFLSPNWVDAAECQEAAGQARDPDLILYAGRLHPIKGVDVLIRAFARVKEAHHNAKLLICGIGEEEQTLRRLVSSLEICKVEFSGAIPNHELLKLMGRAAIFVLPTMTMEGHPKALIEAMACGAACVASKVPGNSDVVVDGETGLLVPPGDVDGLANALTDLMGNVNLRNRLASNAQYSARTYDFHTIVGADKNAIRGLLGQR
jgi:glycosyltransferase involved in cell wall biosynthesis